MPIYINGQKYTGGYQNGHKINLYFEGLRAFTYTIPVTFTFRDEFTPTLMKGYSFAQANVKGLGTTINTRIRPGTYSTDFIFNSVAPMPITGEFTSDAGVTDPDDGINSSTEITINQDNDSFNFDIVPQQPIVPYMIAKTTKSTWTWDGYSISNYPTDLTIDSNAFIRVMNWNDNLGMATLPGGQDVTDGASYSDSAESEWNDDLYNIYVTPTLMSDVANAFYNYLMNDDFYNKLKSFDTDATQMMSNAYRNIVYNNYQCVPIFCDPSNESVSGGQNVTETVQAMCGDQVLQTWKDVTEPAGSTFTDAQWAAAQGETNINPTGTQEYTVSTDSSTPEIDWGYGIGDDGVQTVFYNPVSQPAPTPQPPSTITCTIMQYVGSQYTGEYDNVTFTPNPYRGNSFNVTEAEILYYINTCHGNSGSHLYGGTWPDSNGNMNDFTTYFYSRDQAGNHIYIWDPHYKEHDMGADSGNVDYIGDHDVDLTSVGNGGTLNMKMTYNPQHSWSIAMGYIPTMRL